MLSNSLLMKIALFHFLPLNKNPHFKWVLNMKWGYFYLLNKRNDSRLNASMSSGVRLVTSWS